MPNSTCASLRWAINSLNQNSVVQKLRARSAFAVAATVETGPSVDFQEACRWAILFDDGIWHRLQGRVQPRLLFPEAPYCLWDFELDHDALLFMARFGGVARRNVDVDQWRRQMSA